MLPPGTELVVMVGLSLSGFKSDCASYLFCNIWLQVVVLAQRWCLLLGRSAVTNWPCVLQVTLLISVFFFLVFPRLLLFIRRRCGSLPSLRQCVHGNRWHVHLPWQQDRYQGHGWSGKTMRKKWNVLTRWLHELVHYACGLPLWDQSWLTEGKLLTSRIWVRKRKLSSKHPDKGWKGIVEKRSALSGASTVSDLMYQLDIIALSGRRPGGSTDE